MLITTCDGTKIRGSTFQGAVMRLTCTWASGTARGHRVQGAKPVTRWGAQSLHGSCPKGAL